MTIKIPKKIDESKRGRLEKAADDLKEIYPEDIRGMITISPWEGGEIIKFRIDYGQDLVPNLERENFLKIDRYSVLFEYNNLKYYAFHQKLWP